MNIFFKSAIRSFIKNVNLNIINVLGITIGLAISTLCFLFIQHEFSFDRHFRNIDGIYRIVSQYKDNSGNTINTRGTPSYLMHAVKETCPEVINTSRVFYGGVFIKSPETEDVFSQRVATVDKEIIDILSLNFIRGSKANAFDKPYSIVITEEIASKLFRDKNPIGESLKMQGFYFPDKLFEITGVIDNIPENSSIDFDILTSEGSFLPDWLWRSWSETGGYLPVQTFIHVNKCDINNLNEKINRLIKQNYTPEFHEKIEFDLQALNRIHLYSMTDFSFGSGGNINYIYIFLTLSLLILIIVMINFYNISNGQVYNRVTEVGIKKVFGSTILHLVVSFLFETFILVLICIPLIFLFIKLSLPVFNAAIYSNIDLAILSKSTVFIQ